MDSARAPLVPANPASIAAAAAVLAEGGLVGMPTETVYGLACDAFNAAAAARVFASKGRPSFDPLIVHVAEVGDVWRLVGNGRVAEATRPGLVGLLGEAFWPGALTVVLPKPSGIPGIVTAGLETMGVRVPAHPVARALIAALGGQPTARGRGLLPGVGAVAAPSANVFGGVSPSRAEHVAVACAMVLDGGPCATGVESTVVRPMVDGTVAVLRLGGVSVEALMEVIGEANVRVIEASRTDEQAAEGLASPGTTLKHYAPRTAMRLVSDRLELAAAVSGAKRAGRNVGVMGFGLGLDRNGGTARHLVSGALWRDLSETGDLTEAAAKLFALMHLLDSRGLDLILAEAVPEVGLGRAINDRLRRASR